MVNVKGMALSVALLRSTVGTTAVESRFHKRTHVVVVARLRQSLAPLVDYIAVRTRVGETLSPPRFPVALFIASRVGPGTFRVLPIALALIAGRAKTPAVKPLLRLAHSA